MGTLGELYSQGHPVLFKFRDKEQLHFQSYLFSKRVTSGLRKLVFFTPFCLLGAAAGWSSASVQS